MIPASAVIPFKTHAGSSPCIYLLRLLSGLIAPVPVLLNSFLLSYVQAQAPTLDSGLLHSHGVLITMTLMDGVPCQAYLAMVPQASTTQKHLLVSEMASRLVDTLLCPLPKTAIPL
jgi:hypothetical protein